VLDGASEVTNMSTRRFSLAFLLAVASSTMGMVAPSVVHATPRTTTHLRFDIWTGGDDLRSDSQLEVLIQLSDGRTKRADLHPRNTPKWDNDSFHQPDVDFGELAGAQVTQVTLLFNQGGGGLNGDNWNMQAIEVWDTVGSLVKVVERHGQRDDDHCVKRFKGDAPSYVLPL
jgi:hypothetical protein